MIQKKNTIQNGGPEQSKDEPITLFTSESCYYFDIYVVQLGGAGEEVETTTRF